MSLLQNGFWRIAVVAALVGAVGCQERNPSGGMKSDASATNGTHEASKTTPTQEPPVQSASYNSNSNIRNGVKVLPPAPPKERAEVDGVTRAQAENMIYATIRIKMQEMIEKRAALLKSGRDPSDVEVRELEGSIMRARDLLEENGEIVEPVDPPIVQSTPRQ